MRRIAGALLVAGLVAAGCTRVAYDDPKRVETLTPEYGSTDLQSIAAKMVDSLLKHPVLQGGKRPVIWVSDIVNRTSDYINTKAITDKIQVQLLKSGKVRFAGDKERLKEAQQQLVFQQGKWVDPGTAKKIGKMVGADYLLYGEISSIVKKRGGTKDVFYIITLKLQNVQTGLLEWAEEKEIRKIQKKGLFGW